MLARPGFLILLLQVGLLYSAYPAFLSIAPHLMVEAFGRPPTEFAYYFVFLPLGYFAGNAFVLKFGNGFGQHRLVSAGALFAICSCLLGILLMALGVRHPLALFIPAGAMLNFGLGLALPTVSARAVTQSSPNIGSGWGLVGCAQQVHGSDVSAGTGAVSVPIRRIPCWCCAPDRCCSYSHSNIREGEFRLPYSGFDPPPRCGT